jgi:hypothetical protein
MRMANKGLLTVWTDVDASVEADFHQWYDREHLRERADVPGFLNARRYRAPGSPRFFAAYDTETPDVLSSPVYQQALANQSAWSLKVFPGFRNTVRVVGEALGEAGGGYGGWLLALRCAPLAGRAADLRRALAGDLAASLLKHAGIVRGVAMLGKLAGLQVFPGQSGPPADPTTAVLVVEGSAPAALEALAKGPLGDAALAALGLGPPATRAVYTLQYAVVRGETPMPSGK